MSFIARFVFASLFGLIVAGLIHIGLILYIPYFSHNSAYYSIKKLSPDNHPVVIPISGSGAFLPQPDPFVTMAACTFDTGKGMVRISTQKNTVFQALSIHDVHGRVMLSATDRAATSDTLDVIIGTTKQIEHYQQLRQDNEDDVRELSVSLDNPEGYAVLRILSHSPSFATIAQETAQKLTCQTIQ